MNKLIKFLEENNKWVVRILVLIGLGLIVKLWWFGMNTVCGSSGWISLCIIPEFKYYWTNAGYIAVVFLMFAFYGIYLIKNTDNKIKKVKIAILIFILGIIGKSVFFSVSPDFKFYYTPVTSQYIDEQGKVTDIDKYIELISKYCFSTEDDYLNYKYSKEKMCSMEDKIRSNLGSVENFIKVFDYANKISNELLYRRTYGGMQYVGLENVIEKYNDVTFQAYVIDWNDSLDFLYNYVNDKKLKFFLKNHIYKINIFKENIDNISSSEASIFWNELEKEFHIEMEKNQRVNFKVLYNN